VMSGIRRALIKGNMILDNGLIHSLYLVSLRKKGRLFRGSPLK
jgi:hypothetical protein